MEKIGDSIKGAVLRSAFERRRNHGDPVAYVFGGGGGAAGLRRSRRLSRNRRQERVGWRFGFVSWPIGAYVIKNAEHEHEIP